jgi:hypothetical protein
MKDRQQAMMQGLKMPTRDDCMLCHRSKGSHDAVLKKKPFDREIAWQAIAHAKPRTTSPGREPTAAAAPSSAFKFTGVMACALCHTGPMRGFQRPLRRPSLARLLRS